MELKLITADELEPRILDAFLRRFFSQGKCDFLLEHGAWWHKGNHNRWIILADDSIAGYCAFIPTDIKIAQTVVPAIWWVDIIIAPEYRGRGLQSVFDDKIRENDLLKIGFPNELAARIHKKHGWGVRDDFQVRLLALRPRLLNQVKQAKGFRCVILHLFAWLVTPISLFYRLYLRLIKLNQIKCHDLRDVEELARIFEENSHNEWSTTFRSREYFTRRFQNSPNDQELKLYTFNTGDRSTHYLISRHLMRDGVVVVRILDLFGDLSNSKAIKQLLLQAVKDAEHQGACQVTIMVTNEKLGRVLQRMGFLAKSTVRFCWKTPDLIIMDMLGKEAYWTIADSDNDEIV